jgi:predicted nucleotidyltransferase
MATIRLPNDFKDFLKLLNGNRVEYLLIGGYAVGYHGYPRATGDMDIWVAINPENADRIAVALKEFGFAVPQLSAELFLRQNQIVRLGVPPVRIELMTTISGVEFQECYLARVVAELDGVKVNLIDLKHLKINKKACGRYKDLNDLENLP